MGLSKITAKTGTLKGLENRQIQYAMLLEPATLMVHVSEEGDITLLSEDPGKSMAAIPKKFWAKVLKQEKISFGSASKKTFNR